MAKIALRVYNREIDGMIEGGQLDEAIVHCQYILKTFPMHVETYRLLGKSFLEARQYADAVDIFQRALMAVPDDFVSHVGMSIIRDDEGKLDDAIWHMERAFESQPSNPAIQGELRRLYGRRDGVEPPKIRLSRDALANMYAQGELFHQAIAEIRAVLAEDTNRPDLQVMLARAYYRSGQKVDAAELAANLLKKYPYCMDALRILVDVLPGTTRAENVQVYNQRLRLLDPYSPFVTGSSFSTDQVPDTAVNLERMDYTASDARFLPQPNWASSLGIKLADEKRTEPAPDWMKTGDSPEKFITPVEDNPEASVIPATDEQSIPDWMRSVGWKESSGKAPEGLVDSGVEQPAEPVAQADIPDWLKPLAPKEVIETTEAGSKPTPANLPLADEGEIPDRLAEPGPTTAEAMTEISQPAASSHDIDAFPDWLKEIGETAVAGTSAASAVEGLGQPKTEEPPILSQSTPPPFVAHAPVEPATPVSPAGDEMAFQPTGESKPVKIGDDTLAWLESLAARQGAKEEELLTKPEKRLEEMPDWLLPVDKQPAVPVAPESPPVQSETLPLEPLPELSSELAAHETVSSEELPPLKIPAEGNAQPLNIDDDAMAWLEGLAVKQGAKEDELLTKPENRLEEMPDWLHPADKQPISPVAPELTPAPGETEPMGALYPYAGESATHESAPVEELLPHIPAAEETVPPPIIKDAAMAWRDGLTAKPEESVANLPEDSETPPDWIQEPNVLSAVPEEALAPENPQEDASIASWLSKLDVEEGLGKGQPTPNLSQPQAAPMDEMPDWLKDLEKQAVPEESPKPAEDLPEWLLKPAQPVDQGAAVVSTPGHAQELEMPAWVDEEFPVSEQPLPTTSAEWVPVDEKPTPVPDLEPITKPPDSFESEIPVQPQVLGGTGMLARIHSQDKDAEILAAAQTALEANKLNEAMKAYSTLIKKNRLLDEVIHDLREAIYRFPVDIIVWQTLGDASMRANRLQDALDSYTKAEELLR